jgi:competence protein ComEC
VIPFAVSVAAGALALHHVAVLPEWPWAFLATLSLVLALLPRLRVPGGLLLGFALSGLHGQSWLERAVPGDLGGVEISVSGTVVGIPDHSPRRSRFVLSVHDVLEAPGGFRAERLRVTLFPPEPGLRAGERIRVTLRVRPPRGLHNPSGFDFGTWLYRENLHGQGTVRGRVERLDGAGVIQWAAVHRLRERVRDAMLLAYPDVRHPGVMQALVIGERGAMEAEEWRLFLHTGTNHLMAISGLHVGLVAGFTLFLARGLWRRSPWLRAGISLGLFGAIAAMGAAALYAGLAGFSIPTQRALVMLLLATGALLLGRDPLSWRVYAAALVLVVVAHPPNVLAPGFWFSFGAVATILLLLQGRVARPGVGDWLTMQVILALAMLPLSLAWFQLGAWIAPAANLVAVPVVAFLVLPVLLAGAGIAVVSAPLAMPLLWWADTWLAWLLRVLERLLRLPGTAAEMDVPWLAAVLAGFAVAVLLFPRPW